jgi:4'-phosphopantetheinyl transferase
MTRDIVVARLDGSPEVVRSAHALLSEAERARAARFAFDRDRRRFIVGRAQLKRLLAARLGIPPESVEVVYGAHGKPALAPHLAESNLHFNVSHRDGLAVYAFSRKGAVGIDVEAIRPIPDGDRIASRFFSRHEYASWSSLAAAAKPVGFFNCWTRKEAFVKALGDGLTYPLDAFDVSLAPWEPARILRGARGWSLDSFSPAPGFIGAIAQTESRKVSCP